MLNQAFRRGQRLITFVVCLAQILSLPVPGSGLLFASAVQPRTEDSLPLSLPATLGEVVETFKPEQSNSKDPFIIYIQDAHAQPEAQRKIYQILAHLSAADKPGLIAIEGAEGPLSPKLLNLFPQHPEANQAIIDHLTELGEMTGAELFAWENYSGRLQNPVPVVGVESGALYRRNLAAYRALIYERESIDAQLQKSSLALEALKDRKLSPSLKIFLRERAKRKQGDYGTSNMAPDFAAYLQYLIAEARKLLAIELEDPAEQIRFPQLNRLSVLAVMQAKLDLVQDKAAAAQLTEKYLQLDLTALETAAFPRQILESRLKSEFKKKLKNNSPAAQYLGMLILKSEIESKKLSAEVERLESLILTKLAADPDELKILSLDQSFQNLSKLLHLEMSEDQFSANERKLHPRSFARRLQVLGGGKIVPLWQLQMRPYFESAKDFYRTARRRDQRLLDHTLEAWRKTKSRSAVLIAGGFHSEGITHLLRSQHIPYMVIRPAFQHAAGAELQREVFRDGHAEVVNYTEQSELTKQEKIFLKEIIETGLPLIFKDKHLASAEAAAVLEEVIRNQPFFGEAIKSEAGRIAQRAITAPILLPFISGADPKTNRPVVTAQTVADTPLAFPDYEWLRPAGRPLLAFAPRSEVRAGRKRKSSEPLRIGIAGLDASIASVGLLGNAGHIITAVDDQAVIDQVSARTHPESAMLDALQNDQRITYLSAGPDEYRDLVQHNDLIYLDGLLTDDLDYAAYRERLKSVARQLGDGLMAARNSGDRKRKVFIVRAMVGAETSEDIFQIIKYHAEQTDQNLLNFDVVYQPDFSLRAEDGKQIEPHVVFGLRPSSPEDQNATEEMLYAIYDRPEFEDVTIDFMDIRSAEQAKDALLIYLGNKFVHFNDLAAQAEQYGADLSVIALGSGLDRRLQKLFSNPSMGFGGRLLLLLKWIRAERINRAARRKELAVDQIEFIVKDAVKRLRSDKEDTYEILQSIDKDIRLLVWLENILQINSANQLQFLHKIRADMGDPLKDKKIGIVGVGYSHRSRRVTESPALNLIKRLVREDKVKTFYISDPNARISFEEWIRDMRSQFPDTFDETVQFNFVDSIEETMAASDFTVIASDSNPAVTKVSPAVFKQAAGDKPIFDGINLFGVQADGSQLHSLEDVRASGLNYISLGRPVIGKMHREGDYRATDSEYYDGIVKQFPQIDFQEKEISIFGAGYVGLVTAAILTKMGHKVRLIDVDEKRIKGLKRKRLKMPIIEPGLSEQIAAARAEGKLSFHYYAVDSEIPDDAIAGSSIIYFALPTPSKDTGQIDLSFIRNATRKLGERIKSSGEFKTIVVKSTVTPDTFDVMSRELGSLGLVNGRDYALASNPEFLKEGAAMVDVQYPDRTVIGIDNRLPFEARERVKKELLELWAPLVKSHPHPVLITDTATSTFIKYAANSFLALSITFSNALAEDTEAIEAEFPDVVKPLKHDNRIGLWAFLDPGCGYGGSCFPKDVLALDWLGRESVGHALYGIHFAHQWNEHYKRRLIDLGEKKPGAVASYKGEVAAGLGITFKPETDDVREASSVRALYELLKRGAEVIRFHDPILNREDELPRKTEIERYLEQLYKLYVTEGNPEHDRGVFYSKPAGTHKQQVAAFQDFFNKTYLEPRRVIFTETAEQALLGTQPGDKPADNLFVLTEWKAYRKFNPLLVMPPDHPFTIVDGRNIWLGLRPEFQRAGNVTYIGMGVARVRARRSEVRSSGTLTQRGLNEWPTSRLRSELARFETGLASLNLTQLIERRPELVGPSLTAQFLTRGIFNSSEDDADAAPRSPEEWRLLQLVALPSEEMGAVKTGFRSAVKQAALETLGAGLTAQLFGEASGAQPINLVVPLDGEKVPEAILPLLAAAGIEDRLGFVIQSTIKDRKLKVQREIINIAALNLQMDSVLLNQLLAIDQASTQASVYASARRLAGRDRIRQVGVMGNIMTMLESRVGYMREIHRFHNDGLDADAALLLTAILLRTQLPDDYRVRSLRSELRARGLEAGDFTARVGRFLEAVRHLATQA